MRLKRLEDGTRPTTTKLGSAFQEMTEVAIVHNIPIFYKDLLFAEMAKRKLSFEVLFTAARSVHRNSEVLEPSRSYSSQIGTLGAFEEARPMATLRFVWRALEKANPKIVIISGWSDPGAWAAWLWMVVRHRGSILWCESNAFDRRRVWWKEVAKRLFLRAIDSAHVYGKSNQEYLERLGFASARIVTKRAVVNVAAFKALLHCVRGVGDGKRLLYVGRFSSEKNLPFLMSALHGYRSVHGRPPLLLKLVGYGPEEQRLRTLCATLGLNDIVEFSGQARQDELAAIYGSADALILPSTSETWGLVVNEALLCGLPVLVSENCGCAKDLVTPETGWVFSPTDLSGLIALFERFAAIPRSVLEEEAASRRALGLEYSPERCADRVVHNIRQLQSELPNVGKCNI